MKKISKKHREELVEEMKHNIQCIWDVIDFCKDFNVRPTGYCRLAGSAFRQFRIKYGIYECF